jgi:3-isopropylmalate/(R)-2-methylmalate dehydratase large subunit
MEAMGSLGLSILRDHLVEGPFEVGEYSVFSPDLIMGHDVTAPPSIKMINDHGLPYLRASMKTLLYMDHFTPPKDRQSAESCRAMREFSNRYGIKDLVEWGEGICHVHLFEEDRIRNGQLVIGADSHTTTGGALGAFCMGVGSTDLAAAMASGEFWLEVPEPMGIEFCGIPDVWCDGKDLSLRMISWLGCGGSRDRALEIDGQILKWMGNDGRMTISNMSAETSAVAGMITTDFKEHGPMSPDWEWETEQIDVDDMGPQVAIPGSPNEAEDVENLEGQIVDQVFVGSCTNGRLDDMRILASTLKGRKVHPDVRLLVIPGSRSVYSAAQRAGYLKTIMDAGGVVTMPTCGPCAGGFLGILPDGEIALTTTNRNFPGRMGEKTSRIYISGPAVAGASAIRGMISHPEEVVS